MQDGKYGPRLSQDDELDELDVLGVLHAARAERDAALGVPPEPSPFLTEDETFDLGGPISKDDIRTAVAEGYEARERRNGRPDDR